MLAPLLIATRRLPRQPSRATYFLMPATASAPAGSTMERVSSKMSWMAAQISSVPTSTISSTSPRHRAKVSSPTRRTATPSAKMPTRSSVTRRPARSDSCMLAASCGSTPMTLTPGIEVLDVHRDARDQPAAADRHEDRIQLAAALAQDLHRDRALAGDDVGIVERVHEHQVALARELQRPLEGAVVVVAVQHDLAAQIDDRLHLDLRGGLRHDDRRRRCRAAAPRAPRPGRDCRPRRTPRRARAAASDSCAIRL